MKQVSVGKIIMFKSILEMDRVLLGGDGPFPALVIRIDDGNTQSITCQVFGLTKTGPKLMENVPHISYEHAYQWWYWPEIK